MKLPRITYLVLIFILMQSNAMAQVDSARVDTVVIDTTLFVPVELPPEDASDQQAADEEEPLIELTPWEFHPPLGAKLTATDSTLRWQNWPDWSYKLNRDPGVISYRLGTSVRSNAVQLNAHEPRHQQLYWEDISLNDPVTGMVDWSLIPQHKISEFYQQDLGTVHRSNYFNRQYYLNEPLSRLLYSESKFSFRNLEFEVSHNLSQRTNIELSYWDRRTGGEYDNSEVTGRQIYGKISHHLDNRRYLKVNYVNDSYDIGQPFGYGIPNLLNFPFDHFSATATQSSALSDKTNSLLALNFYQRRDPDDAVDDLHAGIFYRGNERSLTYPADSTRYHTRSLGTNAKKWWNWRGFTLESGASLEQLFNQSGSDGSLPTSNWRLFKTEGRLSIDLSQFGEVTGGAEFRLRSDGFQSYRLNADTDITIGGFTLNPGVSSGNIMPTPQQLYWDSEEFSGNEVLNNEKIQEVRGTLKYNFTPDTEIGVRGQHKDVVDGIMTVDSTFTNVLSYASQSVTGFFEWDHRYFELEGSATMHRFTDSYINPTGTISMSPDERVWLKGSAYWKGYLFDRATYVKAGLSGMMAPFRYQADHYNPTLDYWQPLSNDQHLPVFNRLDVDISARVRSIMFILRWENVLDDVSQLGYFETAQYPMSQRRFIFGVRALFRN